MKSSLYELATLNAELEEALLCNPDEFTAGMQTTLIEQLKTKIDSVVNYYDYLDSQIELAKQKRKEITEFIKARENALENMKLRAKSVLDLSQVDFLDGEICTISRTEYEKKNLVIDDEEKLRTSLTNELQDLFFTPKIVYELNKDELKDALEKGLKLDYARLEKQKDSIRFKTKPVKRSKKKVISE